MWADLNRDGDFDDAGELLYQGASDKEIYTSFKIPSSVPTGRTRMRVSMSWGEYPPSCGEFDYGEVEDYTMYIMPILTTPKEPLPLPQEPKKY